MIDIFDGSKFHCPLQTKHEFLKLQDYLVHLTQCKHPSNKVQTTKFYICRFNQFHWFLSQRERCIHETFTCSNCLKDLEEETIYSYNNQISIPLSNKEVIIFQKFLSEPKPKDRFPNIMNFYDQMQELTQGQRVRQTSQQFFSEHQPNILQLENINPYPEESYQKAQQHNIKQLEPNTQKKVCKEKNN